MRVVVTRPRAQAGPLVAALEALGAEVVECPLIEIVRTSDDPVDCAGYDWLVVTSPNGAEEIARRGRNLPAVAAVGPGTAEALRERGIEPAFVPVESSQDGLLREFPRPAGRVLFAAAEGARRGPIEALGADFVPLYRTRLLSPDPPAGDVVRARLGLGGTRVCRRRRLRTRGDDRAADLCGGAVGRPHRGARGGHPRSRRPRRRRARSDGVPPMTVITFLTDFGLQDDFVGTCHGVIARIAPDAHVIDVTHGVAPQALLQGALVLRHTISTSRWGSTSPSSTRASAGPVAQSRSKPPTGGSSSARTTGF